MKKVQTKRSLLVSALSLVLCFAMLIGTTYAWFSATVTSRNNFISSGNLKLTLEYAYPKDVVDGTISDEAWKTVDEETQIFSEDAQFEPGYKQMVFFRLTNTGSLAFEYDLDVYVVSEKAGKNIAGDEFLLSDYLMSAAVSELGDTIKTGRNDYVSDFEKALGELAPAISGQLPANESAVMGMYITMPETVGNEANHNGGEDKPLIQLGIELVATQYTYEEDAFDGRYDADSDAIAYFTHPGNYVIDAAYISKNGSNDAIYAAGEGVNLIIEDGYYYGRGEVAPTAVYARDGAVVTIKGGTFGVVGGNACIYAKNNAKVIIEGGFFSAEGTAASASGEQHWVLNLSDNTGASIEVYGGTFVNFNPADNESENPKVSFVASGCASVPSTQANGDVWYTVTEGWDGSVDTAWYNPSATSFEIKTGAELAGLAQLVNDGTDTFSKKTITLADDINLSDLSWTPIGNSDYPFRGIFDGANHTIKNLNVDNEKCAGVFGNAKGTIQNLKVSGATLKSGKYAGAICGYNYGSINGCSVENATIVVISLDGEGGRHAGAILGYRGESNSYSFNNNSAKNVTITADRRAGQLVGTLQSYNADRCVGCSVDNVNVVWSNWDGEESGTHLGNRLFGNVVNY